MAAGARRLTGVKRVCIIGGGPSAVAAAKFLQAERCFSQIDIFEQRSKTAGVWQWEPENDAPPRYPIPHANPDVPNERPVWRGDHEQKSTFQSPMYERLEANLPKMLMQHSDYDFPDDAQLYPTHQQIEDYLDRYAADVLPLIKFETQATHVDLVQDDPVVWSVTTEHLRFGGARVETYDAVLVANGHYQIPFVPDYDGIDAFNKAYPDMIAHSKYYNSPEDYRGKRVLIIGYGPSGNDITAQIATTAADVHLSTRSAPRYALPPNLTHRPGIQRFDAATRTVYFTDGSALPDPDAILFCTGYLYSYPFLSPHLRRVLDPHATGQRLHSLYQHLIAAPFPTLAFTCIPWNIIPLPLSEAQGATLARLWSGRLPLPSAAEMDAWERARADAVGEGKAFHKLAPPSDADYHNALVDWCSTADGEAGNGGEGRPARARLGKLVGRLPPRWDARMYWMRVNAGGMKAAFAALGEGRRRVRTLEEIGFVYPGDEDGRAV